MLRTVPGTVLPWTDGLQQNAFAVLSPVLAVTKGLTLSQLRELTGLEGSTIQNWVKRGWVERPTGKRYGEQQIVRIVIINMLRNSMQLDKIIALMTYINGQVDDRSDDIIPDRELFSLLCAVIHEADEQQTTNREKLAEIIEQHLSQYHGPNADSKEKLERAVLCMVLGFVASELKNRQIQNTISWAYKHTKGGIHMILTTTPNVEGYPVKSYLGLVCGEVISGVDFVKDFTAGLTNFFGGRSGSYEKELIEAREQAVNEMAQRAAQMGANAIIGIDIDYEVLGQGGNMLMVTASGTAVTI